MKTGIISMICFMMLQSSMIHSQTLSPAVISSSGGFYTSANAMLSATVAEMTMVETFTSTGNILTQGFQQPFAISVDIPETPALTGDVMIYPNPTNGPFVLNFSCDRSDESQIKIYDLVGQQVYTKNITQILGSNTIILDISSYRQGIYLLELTRNENGVKQTKFYKINLVY